MLRCCAGPRSLQMRRARGRALEALRELRRQAIALRGEAYLLQRAALGQAEGAGDAAERQRRGAALAAALAGLTLGVREAVAPAPVVL